MGRDLKKCKGYAGATIMGDGRVALILDVANLAQMAAAPTTNPEINRMLGTEGTLGAMIGLDAAWAQRAIAAGGNYGEIFAANIGEATPIGLARGLNALWTQGGLQYAPPSR